jgi:hypothetical protein
MKIVITSLLTISLLVVAPGCKQSNTCPATRIDSVNTSEQEELSCVIPDETVSSQNVKC